MNFLETTQTQPLKAYKVFLVEEGDDLRERVISATSKNIQIDYEPVYEDIDTLLCSSKIFKTDEKITLTIELAKREDGSYYTVENFYEESLCDHEEDF